MTLMLLLVDPMVAVLCLEHEARDQQKDLGNQMMQEDGQKEAFQTHRQQKENTWKVQEEGGKKKDHEWKELELKQTELKDDSGKHEKGMWKTEKWQHWYEMLLEEEEEGNQEATKDR